MKRQTILLLHGWIRNSTAKNYYAKIISGFEKKGYTVYAPDMPGFGDAKSPDYPLTLSDYVAFVHEYIKKHAIQPDILLGHSFGGRVIIKYLSQFPFSGRAIVMTGTPGYSPVHKVKMMVSFVISKVGNAICSVPLLSKFRDTIRARFYYLIGARDFYRANGAMRQTFKNIVQEPLEQLMKTIHIPTLLVWGKEDVIVPLRVAQKMKQTISTATLVCIPACGHGCIIEAPEDFMKETMHFMNTL